ncbi:MAG: ATP-binding protein [Nitriliruptoraceae bacterium]
MSTADDEENLGVRIHDASAGDARQPAPGLDQLTVLLDRVRDTGLQVDHHITGTPVELPPALQLTAYRAIQEALTNVIRHSDATWAKIRLSYSDQQLRVQIDDDGVGLPGDHAEGFGLRGLRERVEAIGGTMNVGPTPSGGFRLRADLPYLEGER